MNILIIEDETAAATHLQALLIKLFPRVNLLSIQESVRSSTIWLKNNPVPDLIISDIQLADGSCFELFSAGITLAPILFTTAYDEYMQQAFKLHSIDYLLKPIDEAELKAAVEKFLNVKNLFQQHIGDNLLRLLKTSIPATQSYKSRFLVKTRDRLSTVSVENVVFLRADERITFLHDNHGQKFVLDESLDDLEKIMDPSIFFRLNRRFIAPITSIEKIQRHFNGRLLVKIKNWDDDEIFISREKARTFKEWLDGH